MSFGAGPSRIPVPRVIQGSTPGMHDPFQPSRILRTPGATLSFASFDPLTASSLHPLGRKRVPDELASPKRIVIETTSGPHATSRWRFVPRARREAGVENEGVWPRQVDLCGELVIMSEDQWDIHKLDPEYDCCVFAQPRLSTVTRKPSTQFFAEFHANARANGTGKRRRTSPSLDDERSDAKLNKKFRTVVSLVSDEDEDSVPDTQRVSESDDEADEVEDIIVDSRPPGGSEKLKNMRRKQQEARNARREKVKTKTSSSFHAPAPEIVDLTMTDESPSVTPPPNGMPKRKEFQDPDASFSRPPDGRSTKRLRTRSPDTARAELHQKRDHRDRRREETMRQRDEWRRQQREESIWASIFPSSQFGSTQSEASDGDIPNHAPEDHADTQDTVPDDTQNHAQEDTQPDEVDPEAEEEARHQRELEESRRKMAELEKDRPVWEQEARKRRELERAEEEAARLRKARRDAQAKAAAEEERRRQAAAQAEADARMKAEREKERLEKERARRRQQQQARWSYGPWTAARAIERYKAISETFDAAKFTAEDPVDFEAIPWPMLAAPGHLRVEDIEWSQVEEFFGAARQHMRMQDYRTFVEKSHKRFHPDRWRARGILKSIADEETRGCLEVAANTVAQALTPLWRDTKG